MFEGHDLLLFELFSKEGTVEQKSLESALAEHRQSGKSFARVLLEEGLLSRRALLQAVATQLGAEVIDPVPAAILPATLALIDGALARTYGVVPLCADATSVTLLAVNPLNSQLVHDLSFALGRDVSLVVAEPTQVETLIRQHYAEAAHASAEIALVLETKGVRAAPGAAEAELEKMAGQTPIVHFVNLVLGQAIRDHASDIHFEPFEHEFKIRSRIDGSLHEMAPPPRALAVPIISRLKVLANLNIAEHRVPQDGRIKLTLAGRPVDLRVSTLPTQFGESVVLRVLDQSAARLDLGQLSLPRTIERAMRAIISKPNGLFVVTGPTGSGKTTTLYSCLKELNSSDVKILTVEDPVEYEIDGIMQVPVNHGAKLTFARALRTFLRHDPDIVMVGEVRDLETAQIAIQASLTGHLVLSTLHTNDAAGAVTRLTDMGIEPFLLASTLEAVLAQRLVRRICPGCRAPVESSEIELRQIGYEREDLGNRNFYRGLGCADCHGTGYRGRLGLFEFLRVDDVLRELIVSGASLVHLREQAIKGGLVPLRAVGLEAIFSGETTVDEVIKYM